MEYASKQMLKQHFPLSSAKHEFIDFLREDQCHIPAEFQLLVDSMAHHPVKSFYIGVSTFLFSTCLLFIWILIMPVK